MSWRCGGRTNGELVDNMVQAAIVKNGRVAAAMKSVDRAAYCATKPYADSPQRIGFGATISAPHMHGYALEWLAEHLHPGRKVLDVGCGSGYLTACFASMVRGEGGMVVGIDHIDGLVALSESNMRRGNPEFIDRGDVCFGTRDGFLGAPDHGPYDVIHVGAAAPALPPALVEQLAPGGKMVIPVGPDGGNQQIMAVTRSLDGRDVVTEPLLGVRYIPLTTPEKQLAHK